MATTNFLRACRPQNSPRTVCRTPKRKTDCASERRAGLSGNRGNSDCRYAAQRTFPPGKLAPAVIGNPLAEDASVMRSTGIVSMLRAIEWNLNHGQRNLRLFEIGKTYELRDGEPVETQVLTLGATGMAREKTIYEAAREFSFADLKGDLDRIGELVGGFSVAIGRASSGSRARARRRISLADKSRQLRQLGVAGQLARRVADQINSGKMSSSPN